MNSQRDPNAQARAAEDLERPELAAPGAGLAKGKVLVVAELTSNHYGDRDRLETMIKKSADAGADLIKLQRRDVNSFYDPSRLAQEFKTPFGETFGDFRRAVELSDDDFRFVDAICSSLSIPWYVSTLDLRSFESMRAFDPILIKLPSTISLHRNFLDYVAESYSGDLVISTGMTEGGFEEYILERFTSRRKLYLLQCVSAYPPPIADCNVAVVRHYRDLSRAIPSIVPGYSSHDLGHLGSLLAVAAGARMLEKHVTLGAVHESVPIDPVAVDLRSSDFHDYVNAIRLAESMLGQEQKFVLPSEYHKYQPIGDSQQ
jgi:N-acetylneuraminate synthase